MAVAKSSRWARLWRASSAGLCLGSELQDPAWKKTVISLACIQVAKESMILHAMLLEERFRAPMITNTSPSLFTLFQRNDIAAPQGGGGLKSLELWGAPTAPGVSSQNLEIKYKKPNAQKM
jgi:hypothetical protein